MVGLYLSWTQASDGLHGKREVLFAAWIQAADLTQQAWAGTPRAIPRIHLPHEAAALAEAARLCW